MDPAERKTPSSTRIVLLAALSALIGGLAGGSVIYLAVRDAGEVRVAPSRGAPAPPGGTELPGSAQALPGSDQKSQVAEADRLAAAGRLREAQEAYLTVLIIDPEHEAAMRGLVRVVRSMARGNQAALRRQAGELRRAIAGGLETEEHYTPAAMEVLMRATLLAAGEPPAPRRQTVQAPPPPARRSPSQPSARPVSPTQPRPQVRTAPRPQPAPSSRPSAPIPAPARPAPTPPPSPASIEDEPFFTVAVGPIASGERASAIGAELTVAGFAARVQRQGAGSYIIIVGPYRQSEARRAADHVRATFGQSVPIALAPVRGGN